MLRLRRRKKSKIVDEKRLSEIMHDELQSYIKREELQGSLEQIEKDKRRKKLWDSLPGAKRLKVLRFVMEKKRRQYGKK